MNDEHIAAIEEAISTYEAEGMAWTNKLLYKRVRGNYAELSRYLKKRRAGMNGAVVERRDSTPFPQKGETDLGELRAQVPPVVPCELSEEDAGPNTQVMVPDAPIVGLQQIAGFTLPPVPPGTPQPQLEAFRAQYPRLLAAAQGTPVNSPERIALGTLRSDFHRTAERVRFLLRRARKLQMLEHRAPAVHRDIDAQRPRAQVIEDDLAVIARFVGDAEARALLASTTIPQWSLEG